MEPSGSNPSWLNALLEELREGGEPARLHDVDLKRRGLSPEAVRRWFRKHHGMTFHAYARQLRINHAYGSIRGSRGVLESAYESGYDSVSGCPQRAPEVLRLFDLIAGRQRGESP